MHVNNFQQSILYNIDYHYYSQHDGDDDDNNNDLLLVYEVLDKK